MQVLIVPTRVKDLVDLIFLPCCQLHRWWWWGLASSELRTIMGFEEGDMKNIMNLEVGWKGATGLMQSTIRNGPNFV